VNPQGAEWLAQLRDIHAAPPAPWWPPAPGWWVLAAVACVALVLAMRLAAQSWRRRQRRRRLDRWLSAIQAQADPVAAPQDFIAGINRLLKLVAIRAFPEHGCRRLQGPDWTEFLQRQLDGFPGREVLAVLASGPYQPQPEFDAAMVTRAAREWIRRHG
jgi:hypothetical protein